jgi:hypothetical protein
MSADFCPRCDLHVIKEHELRTEITRLTREVERLRALLQDVVNFADDRVVWSPRLRRNIDDALAPAAQGTQRKHTPECSYWDGIMAQVCNCGATDTQGAAK